MNLLAQRLLALANGNPIVELLINNLISEFKDSKNPVGDIENKLLSLLPGNSTLEVDIRAAIKAITPTPVEAAKDALLTLVSGNPELTLGINLIFADLVPAVENYVKNIIESKATLAVETNGDVKIENESSDANTQA